MLTFFQYYRNCTCCASGSSGSGICECSFFTDVCSGNPVVSNCKTSFVVNLNISWAGCTGTPLGSCGSGSSGSGFPVESGLVDGEVIDNSGSSSGSCRTTCSDCCNMLSATYELPISCIGDNISKEDFENYCLQIFRNDGTDCYDSIPGCNYFSINKSGMGYIALRIDGYYLTLYFYESSVICNPVEITGVFDSSKNIYAGNCLYACVIGSDGSYHIDCITGSFTITEALP